jgi:uncharacterized repeat protein (TIGR01451 family)
MRTMYRIALAATMAVLLSPGLTSAQILAARPQGGWSVTITPLPDGSKAHSINEAGEIVGEGLSGDGRTIRPIWLAGQVIGYFEGIAGNPYSWDNQRHAVGRHVVNSKISCNVWWTPTASGQIDACNGSAYDINETGESAGSARFTTPSIHSHTVTWREGTIYRDLGLPPGARESQGAGINDRGDVVGNLTDASTGRIEAFVHRDGQYTRLQSLPGNYASYAWDINNHGDIVGTSNGGVPVIWKRGSTVPTVLPVPPGRYPRSVARINDDGDIIGTTTGIYPIANEAVMWRNGEFIALGVLPTGSESYAYDINNAGVVVGTSTTGSPYGWHAVTWQVHSAADADLSLALSDAPDPVRKGETLTYTIIVTNAGPGSSTGIVVSDALPASVSLLSATASQGSCTGNSTVICTLGTLAPGATASVTLSTRALTRGTASNTASVSATTADPAAANNRATVKTKIRR